jgi:hypothetical protein
MKTLLKFAMGVALAGALVRILMQKQTGNESTTDTQRMGTGDGPLRSYDQNRSSPDMAASPDTQPTDEVGAGIASSGYSPSPEEGARSQDWNGQRSGF